ncbi:MAG TPA: dihydrodipicolinate synthase family protein [Rhodothermales bacterium]|nr:dihydrodipicolinate synthase family protein [Rhodothermales bacterium]
MSDGTYAEVAPWLRRRLFEGLVIPAHPLALFEDGTFDEASQRGLTRYYHGAGAGGIAVAVHTTQFSIREPQHGLLEPVLRIAAEEIAALDEATGRRTVLIAGVVGRTEQAVAEARLAASLGYHAALLSLAAFPDASDDELIAHCRRVAAEIPLFGFYLQRAVGGRRLSKDFWKQFAAIPNVVGIKIAAFNRYETIDVVRAVAEAGREREVALYTGNDDHIVLDLITTYEIMTDRGPVYLGMAGGLLGQWAVWTKRAVEILDVCKKVRETGIIPAELITLGEQLTEANAAVFDVANDFAGCIAGINEVLRREGRLKSNRCLDEHERLSPGQEGLLSAVRKAFPEVTEGA